jgi:hypothetical protein
MPWNHRAESRQITAHGTAAETSSSRGATDARSEELFTRTRYVLSAAPSRTRRPRTVPIAFAPYERSRSTGSHVIEVMCSGSTL